MADYTDRICPQGPSEGGSDMTAEQERTVAMDLEQLNAEAERLHHVLVAKQRAARGTVIFDLDGVLANSNWRLPIINGAPEEQMSLQVFAHRDSFPSRDELYEEFYSQAAVDSVYPLGRLMFERMNELFRIEFWTGRPEKYRELTVAWLGKNNLIPNDVVGTWDGEMATDSRQWLMMRENGSRMKASQLKKNMLIDRRSDGGLDPVMLFDDDLSVVKTMNGEGVPAMVPVWHGREIHGSRG